MEVLGYTRDAHYGEANIISDGALYPVFKWVSEEAKDIDPTLGYKPKIDVAYVEIHGDNGFTTFVDKVEENPQNPERDWIRRFPGQWKNFVEGKKDALVGTPLSELFPTSPSRVDFYKAAHIYTVEQLAKATQDLLSRLGMGTYEDQALAVKHMEIKKEGAVYEAMARDKAAADAKIAELVAQNADLNGKIGELMQQVATLISASAKVAEEEKGIAKRK